VDLIAGAITIAIVIFLWLQWYERWGHPPAAHMLASEAIHEAGTDSPGE
jgi:hypothetical protein